MTNEFLGIEKKLELKES